MKLSEDKIKELTEEKRELQSKLTGDMFEDGELSKIERIAEIKRQIETGESEVQRPSDSDFECVGCGS